MTRKPCPDCKAEGRTRYASCKCAGGHSASRCHSHGKAKEAEASARRHDRRQQKTYGLGPGESGRLLAAQGGACAVCRRKFSYRLDTDHAHATGAVRMLACKSCNRKVLRYARNNPATLREAARQLENPIAVEVLGFRGLTGEPPEIWRPIPGYGGWYEASNRGNIRSWVKRRS